MNFYSPYQFALFRILFGLYLLIHFLQLIPYAPELFSANGMIADPSLLPTSKIFPNLLALIDSSLGTQIFIGSLALFSLLLTVGMGRLWVSPLLWYGWACLLNRNIFISNPGIPFVGWLLLALALIPKGEPLSYPISNRNPNWQMPELLFNAAWILMAVSYTVSGIHKLGSPSWQDGTALLSVAANPLARDYFLPQMLHQLPLWVVKFGSWSALALEVLFLPLCLFSRGRMLVWLGTLLMHLGILSMVNFTDLTLGILMFHLFVFDPRWIPVKAGNQPIIIFFDGVCGLCNHFVDFVIQEDKAKTIKYAPLQGPTASDKLGASEKESLETVRVFDPMSQKIYDRSGAIVRTLCSLGGFWRVFGTLLILTPRTIRDSGYDLVAKHRYRLFGKKDACRLPTPAERDLFLP